MRCATNLLALTVCCLMTSTGLAENPTRIAIKGTASVTDGWVRTNGTASFSAKRLEAHGRAWSAYDHVLMRFDLSAIGAAKFGRVKRAVLRLYVLEAQSEKKHVTKVAPARTPWTEKATDNSPLGDGSRWPERNQHPNIIYTMIDDLAAKQVIEKAGKVEFDVTATVARWLYQGLDNNGFLVSASPAIFGMPDAGSWQLSFASSEAGQGRGPALIVEMEGDAPTPERARERALALYPSAAMAPVKDPYYFVYYSAGSRDLWQQMPTMNMTTYSGEAVWLAPRGVMNLAWAEGGPIGWLPDAKAYQTYYAGTAKVDPLGFCGHESNLGEQLPWLVDAFRAAETQHPARFSAYYYRGESLMAKAAGVGHIDLLIQEGYTSTHKQFPLKGFAIGMRGIKSRIDTAREHGAIERHIVMLGHICQPDQYHDGHELTPDVIDGLIGELRAYAPEMPGVGFYGAGGYDLAIECDRLARKHFVEPAPDVLITEPRFEQTLNTPHVTIRAEAKAKNGNEVIRYRWFIDARLVAETTEPEYLWDLRGELSGRHAVTVHAVDDEWNCAASQIVVTTEL